MFVLRLGPSPFSLSILLFNFKQRQLLVDILIALLCFPEATLGSKQIKSIKALRISLDEVTFHFHFRPGVLCAKTTAMGNICASHIRSKANGLRFQHVLVDHEFAEQVPPFFRVPQAFLILFNQPWL